ncbi:hypothetical protein ACVW0P_000965 [Mucilaginibacter sp. UYNi724]
MSITIMHIKSLPKSVGNFLMIGMLTICFNLLLSQFTTVPDFLRGALTGVGIGMEIIALIRLVIFRQKVRGIIENQ